MVLFCVIQEEFFFVLMIKNLPANAGDTVSIPGLGRSHILWRNKSPWATNNETHTPETHALQQRVAPTSSNKTPVQPKVNE